MSLTRKRSESLGLRLGSLAPLVLLMALAPGEVWKQADIEDVALKCNHHLAALWCAHLHGTTFDLSYATYDFKRPVTPEEADYLKEILAVTLFELRREKKCWVTYEIFQTCFHIVAR